MFVLLLADAVELFVKIVLVVLVSYEAELRKRLCSLPVKPPSALESLSSGPDPPDTPEPSSSASFSSS